MNDREFKVFCAALTGLASSGRSRGFHKYMIKDAFDLVDLYNDELTKRKEDAATPSLKELHDNSPSNHK